MSSFRHSSADDIVDKTWSQAVDKITKSGGAGAERPGLGEGIDLAVVQAGTSALLAQVPAFDKLLYNSGYAAATRNTYLLLRRLGMPTDFFWKFEQWDANRAYETLDKVITRILTAMLAKEGAGTLNLVSADPVRLRFELRFDECAECSGLTSDDAMCFFNAGSFAGMLGAMLNLELDAWEVECGANSGRACRFMVGERADREVSVAFERWTERFSFSFDPGARFTSVLAGKRSRAMGDLVDIGYYQMLVASALLTNLDLIERAMKDAGRAVGRDLAPVIADRFGTDPEHSIKEFYHRVGYASVTIVPDSLAFRVEVADAPEYLAPLTLGTVAPFLAGEIEGLLSALAGRPLEASEASHEGETLVLRFTPQIG